ncbi:MAG: LysM peptidoglycan-binding domain-containing protein [Bryobacterales bacterium]|nr:LysM peptidoglycan-binding domain-containing protein [Bryobacterales bacterium]
MSVEALKAKYKPVIDFLSSRGAQIPHLHEEGGKLVLAANVHDEAEKNRVWEQIKAVDGNYDDLKADIRVDASVAAPAVTYTVQGGDTLSKISKQFYGSANQYMKIFEANKDQLSDPDKIKPGQVLNIPNA